MGRRTVRRPDTRSATAASPCAVNPNSSPSTTAGHPIQPSTAIVLSISFASPSPGPRWPNANVSTAKTRALPAAAITARSHASVCRSIRAATPSRAMVPAAAG